MKAITIKQPWASLIVEPDLDNPGFGIKPIENRTWLTKFRGRVLVHAGLSFEKNWWKMMNPPIVKENIEGYKFIQKNKNKLPTGAIIGSVEIVDCVINHPSVWAEKSEIISKPNKEDYYIGGNFVGYNMSNYNRDLGAWKKNKPIYNWVLANPIKFPEPIPCKGKLSFWDYSNILADPEEKGGELFCHCQLSVKEENQVTGDYRFGYYCRYCGGKWYK